MIHTISVHALQKKLTEDADKRSACVDVRTEVEHDTDCIAGSINIPIDQLRSHVGKLKDFHDVYVYCASGNRSAMACDILQQSGIENLYDVHGGLNEWKLQQLPTVGRGKNRLPLMQQVLIVVGVVVSTSVILAYNVHDAFLLIPLFMSVGLIYAGISGNCLMTKVLIKMPWNRRKL